MNDAIILSGMITRWRQLEVRANNLANAETPGFQALHLQAVTSRVTQPAGAPASDIAYAATRGTWRDTEPGPIQRTGNALDLALGAAGYFTVMTPAGTRLTRDGHFTLDATGTIVDQQGDPLLDSQGQNIQLGSADGRPSIASDGTISGKQGVIGRIGVVEPTNPQALASQGGTLLAATSPTAPVAEPHLLQGAVEGSTTNAIAETVGMVDDTRQFQLIASMLKAESTRRNQAIQQILSQVN
ncbi:MAG: flagellar hook basal-body protein [Rhodospirillales bacterium]|nr:flagellar hook basal-body protein [Rhodospirillales bacterium]